MFRVSKTFRFEAAHRLLAGCLSTECSDSIHGHSYLCELTAQANTLDKNGMVIDFGSLKEFIRHVMEVYDHALLLPDESRAKFDVAAEGSRKVVFGCNPTAEHLARILYGAFENWICGVPGSEGRGLKVVSVRVWETPTSSAEFSKFF